MAEKNVQIKVRNENNEYDVVYPKTKAELVEGLQEKLDDKVDKVEGKGLSSNDFTDEEKAKLASIEEGANKYIHPDTHPASMIEETPEKQFVSQEQIEKWDNKQDALGFTPENVGNKNKAGGYAGLDANAKIPLTLLPDLTKGQTFVVTDSTERESLTGMLVGDKAYETSTGDSYIWDGEAWQVLAKAEWENINLQWVNIIDKPNATVQEIDETVQKKHDHNNKDVLDKITASGTENSFDLSEFVKQGDLDNYGLGDMLKSVYDTNNDGIVDHAEVADKVHWDGVEGKPTEFTPIKHTHQADDIIENSNKRFVSDDQITSWNKKSRVVVSATQPTENDVDIWYQEI